MAEKKTPTQAEAVEQVNEISANSGNPNDKPRMVDPIIYRSDYRTEDIIDWRDPKKLNNADLNISQYGDDSSAKNYNNSDLWWGENQKYTWENTKNSQVAYNANATLEWLDPTYKYGQAAQMANSEQANYIARRNDEIASALYNAWKTSMEDVASFLNQQEWFRNSYENERQNTILSVWKRLGDIAAQNQGKWTISTESTNSSKDTSNEALKNMEDDLNKSTAWELYGKVTADKNQPVKTLEDENSVYKAMNEARIASFKNLQAMDSNSIAAAVVSWAIASDSQQMRDLMQYDPAKYQEVKTAEKQLRWQMNINTITSGEWEWNTSASSWQSGISNEIADFASSSSNSTTSTADILKSVNSSLNSNVNAASASETMAAIEWDMATLQNRLKNLRKEANTVFRWDVPQYIVNAYIANRTAEIQDQLSILENRYNAAQSRYQTEWEQTKWNAEYNLKKEELELKRQSMVLDEWATKQGIAIDWYKAMWSSTTWTSSSGGEIQLTTLSRDEVGTAIDSLVESCLNWKLWNAQCAAWIQKYYLPSLWVDLWTLSKYSEKQWICNETDLKSYTPQKWDIVVMSSPSKPENWHMWIVVSVEWDTLKYLDWNGSLDANGNWTEKAQIRETKISNSRIYWYYNPTKKSTQNTWEWYYDPNYADIYSNFLQWKMYTEWRLNTAVKTVWAANVDELREQANAWKDAQASNESAINMLRAVEYLMSQWSNKTQRQLAVNDGRKLRGIWDVLWWIDRFFWWDAANYNSYYRYIKDNMTLDHLVELKNNWATFWALSNQELDAIGNAALALSSDMWWSEFNSQLYTIYNKLRKNVGERELTKSEFNEMISAEDDDKADKRWLYIVLYKGEDNWTSNSNLTEEEKLNTIWQVNQGSWMDFWDIIMNW